MQPADERLFAAQHKCRQVIVTAIIDKEAFTFTMTTIGAMARTHQGLAAAGIFSRRPQTQGSLGYGDRACKGQYPPRQSAPPETAARTPSDLWQSGQSCASHEGEPL